MIGQFVDIDATVSQNALVSIDVTDAGGGGDNSFQTLGNMRRGHTGHTSSLELWDALFGARKGEDACTSQLTFIRQNC
jgi:hypothetical protein